MHTRRERGRDEAGELRSGGLEAARSRVLLSNSLLARRISMSLLLEPSLMLTKRASLGAFLGIGASAHEEAAAAAADLQRESVGLDQASSRS